MTQWGWKRWVVAMGGAGAVALAIGLPTEIIPNPWFHRMIPVEWWNAPVLAATAMLSGLLLATYVRDDRTQVERELSSTRGGLGGVLAFFAVGCPVCNKLVVVALGTSGAMSWFAPAQPFLAAGALVLLATALRGRLHGERVCRVPAAGSAVSDASRPG